MRELVDNGPPDETCCHRSYSNELAFDFNKDKIHENEVLGILMKHQYIQKMFMHLVYHFHGILVNQLYKCTHNYLYTHALGLLTESIFQFTDLFCLQLSLI